MSLLLTLGIVGVIVILMTATTIVDIEDRRADTEAGMRRSGEDLAALANGVLPDALNSRDVEELGRFASALWAQRDTHYVKIFDSQGNQLVGPGEDQFPRGVIDKSVPAQVQHLQTVSHWTDDGLEVIAPVTSGAQLVGAVQFGFDRARIEDEIRDLTLSRIYQTLFLVCLGFAGSVLVSAFFTRPISDLVHATQRVARGDLSVRVANLRGKEMRELGTSFNAMAGELERMVDELQESRRRIVTGEEQVRRDIASHLHGPVQGRLLALRVQLDAVQKQKDLPPGASQDLREIIDEMGRVIQTEIAVLSHRLYPAIIRRGLCAALQSLCDEFDPSLKLELRVPASLATAERSSPSVISERTRLAAFRIGNEALTNILKHAPDSAVTVSAALSDSGWLTLTIADDGPGFDVGGEGGSLGLAAMRDYAEGVGGTCTIQSVPGAGTSVIARLPASAT